MLFSRLEQIPSLANSFPQGGIREVTATLAWASWKKAKRGLNKASTFLRLGRLFFTTSLPILLDKLSVFDSSCGSGMLSLLFLFLVLIPKLTVFLIFFFCFPFILYTLHAFAFPLPHIVVSSINVIRPHTCTEYVHIAFHAE